MPPNPNIAIATQTLIISALRSLTAASRFSRSISFTRPVSSTSQSAPFTSPKLKRRRRTMDGNAIQNLADQAAQAQAGGKGKGHGGGDGGRGGGGRRGGGGGGGSRGREVSISRALSRLLRHQAENAGIPLDGEGYAPLDKVLAWPPIRSLNVTLSDVRAAVADSDKQRFALRPADPSSAGGESSSSADPADYLIRANQGHSIRLDSAAHLVPVTLEAGNVPPVVVHGTYYAFWPAIAASGGLRPMGRNHVHCGTGLPGSGPGQVVSGMRGDAELLVYVDVEASLRDEGAGIKWWMSENGVVLTEGDADGVVPAKYFREVVGRRQDEVGVLWKDGEKVADLPEGLRIRVPQGKERVSGGRGRGRGGRGGRGRGGHGEGSQQEA